MDKLNFASGNIKTAFSEEIPVDCVFSFDFDKWISEEVKIIYSINNETDNQEDENFEFPLYVDGVLNIEKFVGINECNEEVIIKRFIAPRYRNNIDRNQIIIEDTPKYICKGVRNHELINSGILEIDFFINYTPYCETFDKHKFEKNGTIVSTSPNKLSPLTLIYDELKCELLELFSYSNLENPLGETIERKKKFVLRVSTEVMGDIDILDFVELLEPKIVKVINFIAFLTCCRLGVYAFEGNTRKSNGESCSCIKGKINIGWSAPEKKISHSEVLIPRGRLNSEEFNLIFQNYLHQNYFSQVYEIIILNTMSYQTEYLEEKMGYVLRALELFMKIGSKTQEGAIISRKEFKELKNKLERIIKNEKLSVNARNSFLSQIAQLNSISFRNAPTLLISKINDLNLDQNLLVKEGEDLNTKIDDIFIRRNEFIHENQIKDSFTTQADINLLHRIIELGIMSMLKVLPEFINSIRFLSDINNY
jgi:hypothetical protein